MGARGASLDELRTVYERRLPELCRVAAAIVGRSDLRQISSMRRLCGRCASVVASRGAAIWTAGYGGSSSTPRATPRAKERVEHELDDLAEPEAVSDDPRRELVRSAVEQLPERQRLVLFLRYYADLDYRTIAGAVAISEGTVAATLNAAHGRLRQLLSEVTP